MSAFELRDPGLRLAQRAVAARNVAVASASAPPHSASSAPSRSISPACNALSRRRPLGRWSLRTAGASADAPPAEIVDLILYCRSP
jgi:hypothetical protein